MINERRRPAGRPIVNSAGLAVLKYLSLREWRLELENEWNDGIHGGDLRNLAGLLSPDEQGASAQVPARERQWRLVLRRQFNQ